MNASLCVRSNFSLADVHLTLGGGVRAGEARVSNFFSFDYQVSRTLATWGHGHRNKSYV